MSNQILCGAAKAKISPPDEVLTRVRGLMWAKFCAVADDIYVRTLALKSGEDTALFVEIEVDKAPYPAEVLKAISDKYGIPQENIFYFSTHVHCVPSTGYRPHEAHNDTHVVGGDIDAATTEYEQFIGKQLMQCVDEALSDMKPAKIGYGFAPSQCNANRERLIAVLNDDGQVVYGYSAGPNLFGPADRNLYVVEIKDLSDRPMAFLVNYAVHNVTMFQNHYDEEGNSAVSCDFGGMLSQLIEQQFPGTVALWSSGAAGDVNPLNVGAKYKKDDGSGRPKEYIAQRANMMELSTTQLGDFMKIEKAIDRFFSEGTIGCAADYTETPARRVIKEGKPPKVVRIEEGDDVPPYRVRVHITRIGDLVFCEINGELYSSLGQSIREASPLKDLILITHDSTMLGDPGYILDDDACRNMRNIPEGAPGPKGVGMEMKEGYIRDALDTKARELIRQTL